MSSEFIPLRLVFIGAGGITGAHTKSIEANPDKLKLVAIADLDRTRAEAVARWPENADTAIFDSYEKMLDQ